MAKVEAAVDPDALFVDFDILLGPHWPVAFDGDPFALQRVVRWGKGEVVELEVYLCALSANHGGVGLGHGSGVAMRPSMDAGWR